MNIKRDPLYMAIKRNIARCLNHLQLEGLKQSVLDYHRDKKQDSNELLAVYIQAEADLNPETFKEEILTTNNYQNETNH